MVVLTTVECKTLASVQCQILNLGSIGEHGTQGIVAEVGRGGQLGRLWNLGIFLQTISVETFTLTPVKKVGFNVGSFQTLPALRV